MSALTDDILYKQAKLRDDHVSPRRAIFEVV